MSISDPHTCRDCGCTNNNACQGGCTWAEQDLCSNCKIKQILERDALIDLRFFLDEEFEGREIFEIEKIEIEDIDQNMDGDYFVDISVKMTSKRVADLEFMLLLRTDPPTLESDDSYPFSPEEGLDYLDILEKWSIQVELGESFYDIGEGFGDIKYLYMAFIK